MKHKTILLVFVFMLFASQSIYAETISINVRGKTFGIGDTADNIFKTLKPADSKRKEVVPDPKNLQSLLVTHHYHIEGKVFSLTFARTTDPGPYRLIQISTSSQQKAVSNDSVHALLSPVQPRSAHLWVDTEPADARVRILNIVPVFQQGIELAPGSYHIEVSSDGYVMKNEWIEVAAGEDRIMAVRLEPVRRVVAPPQPKKRTGYTKLGKVELYCLTPQLQIKAG